MRAHYRTLALAVSLCVAGAVYAQTNAMSRSNADVPGMQQAAPRAAEPIGRSQFGQHGMTRPQPRNSVVNVTPVPEPGQWAMMLAGLALVGWIVRRNSKR
jgi:hypothetical protein